MFASARGQAKAFWRRYEGGEKSIYMIGVMTYYFYEHYGVPIALLVHAQ